MHLLRQFAIALTPFILNAELVQVPEIQNPSALSNSAPPQPIAVPETPLILNVEMPAPKQEAASVEATPVATQTEPQKPAASVVETPVVIKKEEPVQATPAVTTTQPPIIETPVVIKKEEPVQVTPAVEIPVAATVQDVPSPPEEVSTPMTSSECLSPFQTRHVRIRHTEAKGVGYQDGYTTLEGFGICDLNSYFMPFIDLRGHVFNHGKLAGNIGIGERTYMPSINHLFGLYVYYDVRQDSHNLTVKQVSPGIEILGKRMEYRVNGYFPVGKTKSRTYDRRFDRFRGNRMVIKRRKKFAMTGGDAEVGAHITQSTNHDVYVGVGPYYFHADPFSAWGGKARFLWRYHDYVSLEAAYTYDHLFKNIFQGTLGFSYPFGPRLKRSGKNCPNPNDLALSRAAFAPYRFEIPVTKRKTYRQKARSVATGRPLTVWFVRNTSSSNGTFESPFPTLAQAQAASGPNDMIYVFPGDGTTRGMDTGIVLKNGQTLYGSGNSHRYRTEQGRIVIPPFSSNAPSLTNAGSIVTLANRNEVSGLNLLVTQLGSNAIDGTSRIEDANINFNTISGGVNHTGINLVGGGTLLVKSNRVTGPSTNGAFFGILVDNLEQDALDIEVSDNTISGYAAGVTVTPQINPTASEGDVLISGNLISNFFQFGINYSTGMRNGVIRILNNTVLNNAGGAGCRSIAVIVNESPTSGTYFVNNNTIITTTAAAGGASTGILINPNLPIPIQLSVELRNNNILAGATGVGTSGIEFLDSAPSPTHLTCAALSGNVVTLQTPTSNGLLMTAGTGTINVTDFSNNTIPNIASSGNVNFGGSGPCSP